MKYIIILITFGLFTMVSLPSSANIFNTFRTGFYFEKFRSGVTYDKATNSYRNLEAQNALLALHPVGSDIISLQKTLERAGATYIPNNKESNFIYYEYSTRELLLFKVRWKINIEKDSNDTTKLKDTIITSGVK